MTSTLRCLALIAGGYLLGSISAAILVTWLWTGRDIRQLGNRNAGAANVARSVGLVPATLVTLVDFAKGAVPIWAARALDLGDVCAVAGALAAVFGHSFPLYFRFRGGKGLAASLGALLALTPLETLLVLPVLLLFYLVLTGSAVTGALIALSLLTGLNWWLGHRAVIVLAPLVFLVATGLCSLPEAVQDWRRHGAGPDLIRRWLFQRRPPG
jgi:acyl phosphate:glycerol-3-phosphate acyltransferase